MAELPMWGLSNKKRPKDNISIACQRQAEEFLHDISVDFFIQLPKFKNYVDAGFNSDDLTITAILSITECYALNGPDKGGIHNTIDISSLLSVVSFRLKKANPETAEQAREIIKDFVCFGQCAESPFKAEHPVARCYTPEAPDIAGEDDIDGKKMAILNDGITVEIPDSNMGNAVVQYELDEPYNLGKFT